MVVKRGDVLIPLDRNPLEVFLLAWGVFVGVIGAADTLTGRNRAIGEGFGWLDLFFYSLLGGGALLSLIGTFWPDAITGVLLVRAGLLPAGSGAAIYSAGLLKAGNVRTAVIIAAFAVACMWRVVQITRHVRAELAKPKVAVEPPRPCEPE